MVRAAEKVAARISPVRAVLVAAKAAARTSPELRAEAKRVVGPTPGGRVARAAIVEPPSRGNGIEQPPPDPARGDATLDTGRVVSGDGQGMMPRALVRGIARFAGAAGPCSRVPWG